MSDPDHPVWILLTAVLFFGMSALILYCNYNQWEAPKDLTTASGIMLAYLSQAAAKRFWRNWQRGKETP